MNTDVMFSSDKDDWETPDDLFERLDDEFNFTLDVCAHHENTKVLRYISEVDNTFDTDWRERSEGGACWMNPPYGRKMAPFMHRALQQSVNNKLTVVSLITARTDTDMWHTYVMKCADQVRFIKGRLTFKGASAPAPFPSCIVIYANSENSPIYRNRFVSADKQGRIIF